MNLTGPVGFKVQEDPDGLHFFGPLSHADRVKGPVGFILPVDIYGSGAFDQKIDFNGVDFIGA